MRYRAISAAGGGYECHREITARYQHWSPCRRGGCSHEFLLSCARSRDRRLRCDAAGRVAHFRTGHFATSMVARYLSDKHSDVADFVSASLLRLTPAISVEFLDL